MKRLAIFALLVGSALAAPSSKESKESKKDDKLTVNSELLNRQLNVHTSKHEIVSLLVPLNAINFKSGEDTNNTNLVFFFVEADVKDGVKDYKGLYVRRKEEVKKLLETGTDAAADTVFSDTKTVYFAATDGLYVYNYDNNSADKYGTITDNITSIAKVNGTDIIYILTDKNELYKVTEEGTKKKKVDDVVGAQEIVLDYANNLYYYNADKETYVTNENGTKKIEGLPDKPNYIKLLKPPIIIANGVPIVIDNKAYIIYVNDNTTTTNIEFDVHPSAYAFETAFVNYYAYDKKIYEYNVIASFVVGLLDRLISYFNGEIQSTSTRLQYIDILIDATRSRNDLIL